MRPRVILLAVAVTTISLVTIAVERQEADWEKVEEAMSQGLPKTAIEHLQPIIDQALEEGNHPEAIKAITMKIALEGNIEGNRPEERITRMEAAIAESPDEMRPVMDAILANWFWHYFQNNRWRFLQRTATTAPPGEDFTTWDLPRILAEIDNRFTQALSAEERLKAIAVSDYDQLLVEGTMPDEYRPTLYDFLAHEALDFYSSGERAAAKPEDGFDLEADSPIFEPIQAFIGWDMETTDADSLTVKAIRLYQNLLRFHLDDDDPSALADTDFLRLHFGYNHAFGEEKSSRYKIALERFAEERAAHESSARALFEWASVLQQEGELVEARELALRGERAFPESVGGKQCFNLVRQIEARMYTVKTERVWNEPWPSLEVRYRNLTTIHFRAVKYDWIERLRDRHRPEQLNQSDRLALLTGEPEQEWSAALPPTDDYRERVERLPAPRDLPPGFYFLIASHDPDFRESDNQVTFADFWVSDLAIVMRSRWGEDRVEGFILSAAEGEPIAGARAQAWLRERNGGFSPGPIAVTDENGLFSLRANADRGFAVHATHDDQQLAAGDDYHVRVYDHRLRPFERTVFFTDRSLYRPGQTIRYKGLCVRVDQEEDNYQIIPKRSLTVAFVDSNGEVIERQNHRSNDYGSFSGSFTAPRDRLMGRMTIRGPDGETSIQVEEYKRPKFQVTLDAPQSAAKLGSSVHLEGTATAYTGAAVGGAKVRYRVVREVRYPLWWRWAYWWLPPRPTEGQEIAHGTTEADEGGAFPIEFVAKPDPSVSEADEPTFHFTVYADVTDTTGETRSAQRSVNIGYTALQASMTAGEWLTEYEPMELRIRTETLDGEGRPAEGAIKIHRLVQPDTVHRAPLGERYPVPLGTDEPPEPDPSDPNSWQLGDVVAEREFVTDEAGNATLSFEMGAGVYRAFLTTHDGFGKTVSARLPIHVLDPDADHLEVKIPNLVAAPKWRLEPGEELLALWGTGYETGRAFIEIEHRRRLLQSYWTEPGLTQALVKQAVSEAMRGGFTLRVTMVRENRAYLTTRQVEVPWSNKDLSIKWEHFVSKLEPAQKETWTAVITGPDAEKAVAEMVATLYDQSLDAYLPHRWPSGLKVFRTDQSYLSSRFENVTKSLQHLLGNWHVDSKEVRIVYRGFLDDIVRNLWGYQFFRSTAPAAAPAAPMERTAMVTGESPALDEAKPMSPDRQAPSEPAPDLSQVSARQNLDETAFFFPHLIADGEGRVKLEFTMPEALTRWKFMGFAHDGNLRSGFLEDEVVTSKEIMVEPNPPRFLREGDVLEMTVKISNQSPAVQTGSVRLTYSDAFSGASVDDRLGNTERDLDFDVPSMESRSYSWRLTVPDGLGPLTYRAVGSTGRLSDGEEGFLPVLSRRILVTESLPLPIRGPETKTFDFSRLARSGESESLRHQSLTVQMASNPAWYAVMALPYLMEYPHGCSEQVFNRLYANALARHIATSDPKIRAVFDRWKGTDALDSPMEKNQDLKSVMLEETPWIRQARAESQARRNVGILFDENRLDDETARTLRKLAEMQLSDGAWPWFPGGRANDYITLYITTGFGRMRHLGVEVDVSPAVRSLTRLDRWIDRIYRDILDREENHLSPTIALYLYGRSFFLEDKPIDAAHREAVDYFLDHAGTHWLQLANRQSQAHLAVALKRFGNETVPQAILRSIRERSVSNEEMGMFWRETELSWWWYRAPIETQAMMIEAFDEVLGDAEAVEQCKVWLLKQKQTRDWKTTKATADAVYGLLLRGTNLLASDALVRVALGGVTIRPERIEAGTGFYEQRFPRGEVTPQMGRITVEKVDEGVAWGSIHWQYLEDMSKVTPYEGTPLKLEKSLYRREYSRKGPVLEAVEGPVSVGDELVVRIVLQVDRDMEYVHLKDHRGSGTEPVNVLSRYKYQDGLAYYESTRDTASHFFIDYLPKGTYVFEYATRVAHNGRYQTGTAHIQCMYAPEFNSHSESIPLEVR